MLGIPAIAFLITGAVFYYIKSPKTIIDSVANKTIEYINKNLLVGQTASLVSVTEQSGLIKIKIDISGTSYDSYITNDGKLLFVQGPIEMEASDKTAEEKEVAKADNPVLDAFVVSRCPYGLQMQRILADVIKNIPSLGQYVKIRYIGAISNGELTSMHGAEEATENLRQICIREEQADKYWDYVSCQMKTGDTSGCEKSVGLDSKKLNACMTDSSRGIAYAQQDVDLNAKYSVQGSPTLILNEKSVSEFDFGGRTSDGLKNVICAGFNSTPEACSATLTTEQAAAGLSETYAGTGSTNTNSGGGCQ